MSRKHANTIFMSQPLSFSFFIMYQCFINYKLILNLSTFSELCCEVIFKAPELSCGTPESNVKIHVFFK